MTAANNSKDDIEKVLAEFDSRENLLTEFCRRTKDLIETILQDARIRYHSVQARVKSRTKLKEKYLDPTKDYKCLDDVTDLAGLRIITYYADEIDRVAKIISGEFDLDLRNCVDKRDTEPDKFGYSAINYVCSHLRRRTEDVEYRKYAGIRCEIQITSVLRHAWSEMEHDWYDLRGSYPKDVKRRFGRLAALLDLAEAEFLDIRKSRTQYEQSIAVRVEANLLDVSVDAVSLKSFVEGEPVVLEIDKALARLFGTGVEEQLSDRAAELRSKAANLIGLSKLQDLREALTRYKAAIPEFVNRCGKEIWPPPRPGLVTRALSIFHLGMLLASCKGKETLISFLVGCGFNIDAIGWDLDRQAEIAKEVLARY